MPLAGRKQVRVKGDYMKPGKKCAVAITGAAVIGCTAYPVRAQSVGMPQRVFACSLGKKSVSVTAVGNQLIYKFGTPTNTEMSIIGSAGQRDVLYRAERYASMEYQLRFLSGQYSYIIYNMGGNSTTGAASVSGLTVKKGNKVINEMSCRHYTEFSTGFDFEWLPEDTEEYSAM